MEKIDEKLIDMINTTHEKATGFIKEVESTFKADKDKIETSDKKFNLANIENLDKTTKEDPKPTVSPVVLDMALTRKNNDLKNDDLKNNETIKNQISQKPNL